MGDVKQFFDIVYFAGEEGKRVPRRIGYAYRAPRNPKQLRLVFSEIPVAWDGKCIVEPQREREGKEEEKGEPSHDDAG